MYRRCIEVGLVAAISPGSGTWFTVLPVLPGSSHPAESKTHITGSLSFTGAFPASTHQRDDHHPSTDGVIVKGVLSGSLGDVAVS